jgi:hypothetical protein
VAPGAGIGELCLRPAGDTSYTCPNTGKAVLLAYLPASITINPGKAVQLVVKIRFSAS